MAWCAKTAAAPELPGGEEVMAGEVQGEDGHLYRRDHGQVWLARCTFTQAAGANIIIPNDAAGVFCECCSH